MGDVALFPGVAEAVAETEPGLDLEEICAHQHDLLLRWRDLGEELKRRAMCALPFDLALELHDLMLIEEYP